jgi:glycosyltransferase involved in cell wall biosynthesis
VQATWTNDRPLRVLHAIDVLAMGGAQALLLTLLRELGVSGRAQSTVCAMTSRWADPELVSAIHATGARIEYAERGIGDPRLPFAIAGIARASGADVVHSHLSVANVGSRLAARLIRRPHVTTVHTMPGPLIEDSRARARADGLTARLSKVLVAPSVELADAYSAAFHVPRGRFRVIPNAPSAAPPANGFDRDALREQLGAGSGFLVVCVARLQREKGIDDLVEAAALLHERVPGLRVAVAGDGPEDERFRQAIAASGAPVTLLGHRGDVGRLLAAADAFVLPSRHEGLPISLLEAMAAGLPSVATAVGGIPSLVDDGDSGLLVPASDPPALAAALERLAADGDLARRLGGEARRVVERDHSPAAVAGEYAAIYEELAAR